MNRMIFPGMMLLLFVARASLARELLITVPVTDRADVASLVKLGLSVDDVSNGYATGVIRDEYLVALEAAGFMVQIVVDDIRSLQPSLRVPHRGEYHDYGELTADLQSLAATYPGICSLHNLGTSVQGRTIWALEITDNPTVDELEPEVRLIGCHHGNEPISVEVPLHMCHHFLENYGTDPVITDLVDQREIWIIPMMNPDGLEAGSRYNANGIDLNRNYGYMREDGSLNGAYSQPETQAIRAHALLHNFGLSLSYHSGAYYINYLWNYTPVRTPDDAYIVELSEAYDDFVDYGITEGYEWYQTKGDCNDWSYGTYGGMDWTIELGEYEPPQSQIDVINALNRPAIVDFVDRALQGVGGIVTDAVTGDPLAATVNIEQLDWPVFTQLPFGDYHRPLPPGTYTLVVSCPGYETSTETGIVVSSGERTIHHVALNPSIDDRTYARLVVSADSPNYNGNYPYPTHGHDVLGAADNEWFSLGKNGWIVLDMGEDTPVIDISGDDVKIREGGSDGDEGFSLYLGNSFNGPWTFIGSGSGTTSFDLYGSGLSEGRYVYLKDDNVGSASVANPGFDLDAIEVGDAPDEPHLVLTAIAIEDPPPADNDGRLDPGESALLYITVANIWAGEATTVVGTLSTADQYVVIDDPTDSYPSVPGDSSAVNLTGFAVDALASCPEPHVAELTLLISAAGGYSWALEFDLMIGQHELLFVDTDNEATEAGIVAALDAWGGSYRRLNAYNQETVLVDTLGAYRTVLWAAGDQNTSSMTADNQSAMAAYLDQGGALLFSGENYLSTYGSAPFTTDYLHVSSYETSISGSTVTGEAGDPIGDDITVTLTYPSGLAEFPDGVTPDVEASVVFCMQGNNEPVAIRYPGTDGRSYRVVFFTAPLEAFPTTGADPDNIQTVVMRSLTWLEGGEDIQPPSVPTNVALAPNGTLSWSASTDNVGVDHYNIYQSTDAYFMVEGQTPDQTTTGTSAPFPGSVGDPAVSYYFRVTAEDAALNESSPSATVGEHDYGISWQQSVLSLDSWPPRMLFFIGNRPFVSPFVLKRWQFNVLGNP